MKRVLVLIVFVFFGLLAKATHLISAEVRLEKKPSVSSKTYDIVLTIYYLKSSIDAIPELDVTEELITVRDGGRNAIEDFTINRDFSQDAVVNNGFSETVLRRVFVGEYTFEATNVSKIISYTGDQRRAGIENITDRPGIGNWEIYVETFVFVDGSSTGNSTPELTTPPLGIAAKNRLYTYDIAAVDPEGDSLSYDLVALRYTDGILIPQQWFPDDSKFGNSTISIDPITGILTWDSPRTLGFFSVAIQVSEWRNGARVSFSVRDFPIEVFNSTNNPPIIAQIRDTCITTNQLLEFPVQVIDPDGDRLSVSYSGGPKNLNPGMTIKNLTGVGTSTVNFNYNWTPGCDAIQATEHATKTKAWDTGLPSLTSFEATLITVYPEAPSGVIANFNNLSVKSVTLDWDAYPCNGQFNKLIIYRAECDSTLDRSVCDFQSPDEFGYVKVATIAANEVTFVDDNNGKGLRGNVTYHYVITGNLVFPSRIEGPASKVVSVAAALDAPVITNVSVDSTSASDGKITIKWIKPPVFDQGANPGPYTYELYRSQGLEGDNFGVSPIFSFTVASLEDSSFEDTLLNTIDFPYTYKLKMLFNGQETESEFATSTWLRTIPGSQRIDLVWEDNSVWIRPDSLYQVVWQDTIPDNIVDSTNTGIDYFGVKNLEDGITYCHYVETRNVFCVNEIPDVYINLSQVACDVPLDTTPPCPPVLSIIENDCESFDENAEVKNELSWVYPLSLECLDQLSHYKIYFKKHPQDKFKYLDSVLVNPSNPFEGVYTHENIESYTYCYAVTAVDIGGNESDFSNETCNDNCELFDLPNIFTPNADGKNDVFRPFPDSRYIEKINFTVYNRWGTQVYYSENDEWINWEGINQEGEQLADGLYYFSAEVIFDKIDQEGSKIDYKGWVQIIR